LDNAKLKIKGKLRVKRRGPEDCRIAERTRKKCTVWQKRKRSDTIMITISFVAKVLFFAFIISMCFIISYYLKLRKNPYDIQNKFEEVSTNADDGPDEIKIICK
jgi:cell division protein FtsL